MEYRGEPRYWAIRRTGIDEKVGLKYDEGRIELRVELKKLRLRVK